MHSIIIIGQEWGGKDFFLKLSIYEASRAGILFDSTAPSSCFPGPGAFSGGVFLF
jgi:hypothetical protein